MKQPRLVGVLLADVIDSRSQRGIRAPLNEKLRQATKAHMGGDHFIRIPYAITAGDEFQTVAARIERIPSLILDLRRRLYPMELRIGIGLGGVNGPIRPPVNRIGGKAFELARQAINQAKNHPKFPTLTVFQSGNPEFDEVANLVYGLQDSLLQRVTPKQWETMATYMVKRRVDSTARALKVDDSTASRNLKRGSFWQIEQTAVAMERFIKLVLL